MKIQHKETSISLCIKKDDEIEGDNITNEKEGIIEYGDDFKNCKLNHDSD